MTQVVKTLCPRFLCVSTFVDLQHGQGRTLQMSLFQQEQTRFAI